MRPYDLRIQNDAANIVSKPVLRSVEKTKMKITAMQSSSCEWCGNSFGRFDCIESMRDEVFDCDSNHGPFCRECWEEFSNQCIHCNCTKCGVQLSEFIESYEDIGYEIHNCHNNHGPFCYQCWTESSNKCPEVANDNCPPKPIVEKVKCGNCEYLVPITATSCRDCGLMFQYNSEGIVLSRDLDKNTWDDKLRILHPEDKLSIQMYLWSVFCAFYVLSVMNPHWSTERIGIYLVSFLLGWIFFWPFIGIISEYFLGLYCKHKGYDLIYYLQLRNIGHHVPTQYKWGNKSYKPGNHGYAPKKVQEQRWKYLRNLEAEWHSIQFVSTFISGFLVFMIVGSLAPYVYEWGWGNW